MPNIQNNKTVTLTKNYPIVPTQITPDSGYDAMRNVNVIVDVPQQDVQDTIVESIERNGIYNFRPSQDYAGLRGLDLTVNVPNTNQEILQKTYTTNGYYEIRPSEEYAGFKGINLRVDTKINLKGFRFNERNYNINGNYWVRFHDTTYYFTIDAGTILLVYTYENQLGWCFKFYYMAQNDEDFTAQKEKIKIVSTGKTTYVVRYSIQNFDDFDIEQKTCFVTLRDELGYSIISSELKRVEKIIEDCVFYTNDTSEHIFNTNEFDNNMVILGNRIEIPSGWYHD